MQRENKREGGRGLDTRHAWSSPLPLFQFAYINSKYYNVERERALFRIFLFYSTPQENTREIILHPDATNFDGLFEHHIFYE